MDDHPQDPGRASSGTTLHELFEAQADRHCSGPAILCRGEILSYQEVEDRANQLARHLRSYGTGPGKLVGVLFERSEKPILAILACLKAGAGYVPIDPEYPIERAKHVLTDAKVDVLLSERALAPRISSVFEGTTVLIDDCDNAMANQSTARLSREETGVSSNDLCYVMYTSGTTGRPKGVMTEHWNTVQFISAFNEVCGIDHSDRIFQGFSLGFDGSVEEMWMAFSNGATLVVPTTDVLRLGNDVVRLFAQNTVSVFSTVPTFLSMIDEDLPTVRLLIVSGERCSEQLVAKWAQPGRRMLNVYGPTETTVNATVAECSPNKPVTIGRPLRGYETIILDAEMRPVKPGEPGELYIGGVGVARGYLNRPELTAKQFVKNPLRHNATSRKLYRTGDLVCLTEEGEMQFLGRFDNQVKIRGFRIELAEIEGVLCEHPLVHMAVVKVFKREGLKELVAYVVLDHTGGSFDRDDVLALLRQRLPAYMIPGYLDVIDELPTLASGKVDRNRLPEPNTPLVYTRRKIVGPRTELEGKVTSVWEKIFNVSAISIEADFFLDLGGYSLLAAQMVSLLRKEYELDVSIRDVYTYPTIEKLVRNIVAAMDDDRLETKQNEDLAKRRSSREVFESLSRFTRWSCVGLQAFTLLLFYGLATTPLVFFSQVVLAAIQGQLARTTTIWILVALLFGTYPALLISSIVFKWLVIGRYKPGKYPLWSFYYFRWWLASRIQGMSGIGLLSGTPVMSLYYRLMGAKVGRNCILDTSLCTIYDLVSIGDDTCIGAQTQLLGYRFEDGMLILDTVEIGSRCFVGMHCALGLNTRMGDGTRLDDLSLLPDGEVMAPGESRRGSPAQPTEVDLPKICEGRAARRHPFLFGLIHLLALEVLGFIMLIALVPPGAIIVSAFLFGGFLWLIPAVVFAVPINVVSFCLLVAAIKALILRRVEPGVYPVESWFYLRKWLVDVLLRVSRQLVHTLYTTIYLPAWLRLLGSKIGARAEISTVSQITPDLTIIEDESFFADGSMIGGRRCFRGHVELAVNRIGRRSFVGNNAILPVGADLGDNCLLGVLSAPPSGVAQTRDGSEWLGSPAFRLPHRQKVGGFDITQTYRPTTKLYVQRYLIDAMRILIPNLIADMGLVAFVLFLGWGYFNLSRWAIFTLAPLVTFCIAMGAALSVVVLKWTVMGRFKPVVKPLWSVYVWLNELVNGAYETIGAPSLAPLMGTPFFNWYLRLLGCRIGKHVLIQTTLFSEFDLVDIGNYAVLNIGVVLQNHLFEDRIMKSSYLRVGDECSVGNMSVVLYDTEMQHGASIAPLSLLMKGETLPPYSCWVGIPTRQLYHRRQPALATCSGAVVNELANQQGTGH